MAGTRRNSAHILGNNVRKRFLTILHHGPGEARWETVVNGNNACIEVFNGRGEWFIAPQQMCMDDVHSRDVYFCLGRDLLPRIAQRLLTSSGAQLVRVLRGTRDTRGRRVKGR